MGVRKLGDSLYIYPGSPGTFIKVVEDKAVLVDPGHGGKRHKDLRREVKRLGVDVRAQLATHGHADHISVCPRIGAPLFMHRFEFSVAESPLNRELLTFGSKAPEGFLVFQFPEEVKVHAVFEWNDNLFGLRALKLNGHSPGMTGFLDEDEGVIYAGDSFFGERVLESVGVPYLIDPVLFKTSINELHNYTEKGYTLVPSHGKIVEGEEAIELLDLNMRRIEETEALVLRLLENPLSMDELAFRIMKEYGVEITPQKLALNLVPLRAFIAELHDREEVEALIENGLKWRVKRV
ncbi:MBL fold metallo-hydrolase [Thermococcus sp.]|uniref:MBL fold metallo-hydrolase n=1 Tax=Thermococcus sp. TaxID=35749 RepID=UPI0026111A42|nr:MBL fold metallo-hydrolase [Thermococcus sp.]